MPSKRLIAGLVAAAAVLVVAGGLAANQFEASRRLDARAGALTGGGDPERGREFILRRGCGGCHSIPRVPGARAKVGPPLDGFAGRAYIAGREANQPENLMRWIENPHAVDPQTAMPPMGIQREEARDIAAFLYTLK